MTTLFPHYVQSGMTEEVINLEAPELLFLLASEDSMCLCQLAVTLCSLLHVMNTFWLIVGSCIKR